MTDVIDQETEAPPARHRRRWPWIVVAGVLVVIAAVVLFWFQPQKLWIDDKVEDTIPVVAPPDNTTVSAAPGESPRTTIASPVERARGSFISRDHSTSGVVRVLEFGTGSRIVRLEGLKTDNGPDLYLYLTPNPAKGEEQAFDDGHLSLGRLKGNLGDQNYEIPRGTELGRYKSVVIWCDRFNAAFGAADLS